VQAEKEKRVTSAKLANLHHLRALQAFAIGVVP
jgi:hypothetical protein